MAAAPNRGPSHARGSSTAPPGRPWSAWRGVLAFGFVSLFADMVYEGMRSIVGPYLGALGASAAAVGVITGAGEAAALVLRLLAGTLADRTHRHWTLTIVGYGLTAACVPLLAVAPALGSAGVAVATVLVLAERTGKAVRSPSKSVLLASAARSIGRGKGFGVHKALDQVGAFAGPLVVAGVTAVASARVGLAVLVVPGAVAMVLLLILRRRLDTDDVVARRVDPPPDAPDAADAGSGAASRPRGRVRLPVEFHMYALGVGLTTAGLLTFGLLGFHLTDADLVATPLVPVVYAGAMAVAAVAALAAGTAFDRAGGRTLLWLPALVAPVPALVLLGDLRMALAGIALWGAATGIQDSTVKALVADLVPRSTLATAYGVFAAYQGAAALAGGVVAGAMYADHRTGLAVGTAAAMAVAYLPLRHAVSRPTAVG